MEKRKLTKDSNGNYLVHDEEKNNNTHALASEIHYSTSLTQCHLEDENKKCQTTSDSLMPQELDLTISSSSAFQRSLRMPLLRDFSPRNQCHRTLRKRPILHYMEEDEEPIPMHRSSFKNLFAGNDNASSIGDNMISPSRDDSNDTYSINE
jgi:hypothetical protein